MRFGNETVVLFTWWSLVHCVCYLQYSLTGEQCTVSMASVSTSWCWQTLRFTPCKAMTLEASITSPSHLPQGWNTTDIRQFGHYCMLYTILILSFKYWIFTCTLYKSWPSLIPRPPSQLLLLSNKSCKQLASFPGFQKSLGMRLARNWSG